jgi:hypothetical protein
LFCGTKYVMTILSSCVCLTSDFAGHYNYFGTDENYGPIAISMIRESIDRIEANAAGLQSNAIYRLVIRISDVC